jgi:aldehyde dehydrogenase (NAD+)
MAAFGVCEGATLVTGGTGGRQEGYVFNPTVFANVGHDMRISQEEIFGPVAAVIRFSDDDDALRIFNGTKYSMAADASRAHRFARKLKAGTVWVNAFGPTDVPLPWGGSRNSGFGREHGDVASENFTEPKGVWINTGL